MGSPRSQHNSRLHIYVTVEDDKPSRRFQPPEMGIPMRKLLCTTFAAMVLLTNAGAAFAQGYQERGDEHRQEERRPEERRAEPQRAPEHRYSTVQEHNGWRRGQPMGREEWGRGRPLDWRGYGLREPPYGYEWRDVGGVFILGAIATGIVADILLNQP